MLETLPDASEETEKTVVNNIAKLLNRVSQSFFSYFSLIFYFFPPSLCSVVTHFFLLFRFRLLFSIETAASVVTHFSFVSFSSSFFH